MKNTSLTIHYQEKVENSKEGSEEDDTGTNEEKSEKSVQDIKSLFEIISKETKDIILSIFTGNFDTITTVSVNVLNYFKNNKKISNTDGTETTPVSFTFLHYLDLLLISLYNKNKEVLTIINNNTCLIDSLISDFLVFSNNSFLQSKVLKILELILNNEYYKDLVPIIIESESLSKYIEKEINFEEIVDYER